MVAQTQRRAVRIAYVVPTPVSAGSSVGIKIQRQIRSWQDLGVDVAVLPMVAELDLWPDGDVIHPVVLRAGVHPELARQLATRRLVEHALAFHPDAVYTRPTPYLPGLSRLFRRVPTVQEINTDDRVEFRMRSAPVRFLHGPTRHLTLRHTAGFVFVTDELRYSSSFRRYRATPAVTIANGIPLDVVAPLPAPANDRIRAVFLSGSTGAWQGFDKLARLAVQLPDWDFELIGLRPEDAWFPDNVLVRGTLRGRALEEAVAGADVGLGALALHRKQMSEACNLKVRECLAHGLPMVLASRDTDFPDPSWFILQIDNDEQNIEKSAAAIRAFGEQVRGSRVPRAALSHLDSREKEQQRLSFVRDVIARNRRDEPAPPTTQPQPHQ